MQAKSRRLFPLFSGVLALAACQKSEVAAVPAAPAAPASPFAITASIQELMDAVIDPAADALWDSVGTTVTLQGTETRQPRSNEEWQEVRRRAIALIEGTNLLVMDGRKLVAPGSAVLDQNTQGVLNAKEGQDLLDTQHQAFVQFAHALHDVGRQMLTAIDAKDPAGMMNAGSAMDTVCENCHLTFWYPKQVIPELPADFGSSKSATKRKRYPLNPAEPAR
ncbi:MAG TPA: hypothetical protein VGD54_00525 [Steroidobacteraceae bacterium]